MNVLLLMSLAIVVAKEPPRWYEAVYLHESLLPNTVTKLVASEDFIPTATRLAEHAKAHRASDTHPKIVHQNYRATVFGEHIVITPDDEPDFIELGASQLTVLSIVVGFRRKSDKVTCEFTGLFIIDGKGLIHEYFNIPAKQIHSFERNLKGWLIRRINAVEAARARVRK